MPRSGKRFLHVGFSVPATVDANTLKRVFDKAAYWMKYTKNCWILYTGLETDTWRDRIRAIPGMEGANIFLCEFDPREASGYLPEWMWDDLYKDRD